MAIPAGYGEATMVFRLGSSPRDSTWSFGFKDDVAPAAAPAEEAQAIYNAFTASTGPYIAAQMGSDWQFSGVSVTDMTEEGPLIGQYLLPIAGTLGFNVLPPNCAVLMNKNTGVGGRRNRGRAFLPPVNPIEGNVDAAGVIASSFLTGLQTRYTAAFASLVAAGLKPQLFHQTGAQTPTALTSWTLQSKIATQRRRLRK